MSHEEISSPKANPFRFLSECEGMASSAEGRLQEIVDGMVSALQKAAAESASLVERPLRYVFAGRRGEGGTDVSPGSSSPSSTSTSSLVKTALGLTTLFFWFGVGSGVLLARSKIRLSLKRDFFRSRAENERKAEQREENLEKAQQVLVKAMRGLVTSSTIYVGDQLGLFNEMLKAGPVSSQELADRTGLHERWIREWMMQLAAARIFNYYRGRFTFADGFDHVMTNPNFVGLFQAVPGVCTRICNLPEVMQDKHGIGETYDGSYKSDIALAIERVHEDFHNKHLLHDVLTSKHIVNGKLLELLREGGLNVAEVGCGTAVGLINLAKAFPDSKFVGFELSQEAITRAQNNINRSKLRNVFVHDVRESPMEEDTYDFAYCHDVVHDCCNPLSLLKEVNVGLKPGGSFLIVDIECYAEPEKNIKHPSAELRYGLSCAICLHSGSTEPNGARLGTMGLHPEKLKNLMEEANFTNFHYFHIPELLFNTCHIATRPK